MSASDVVVAAAPPAPRSLASWIARLWRAAKRLYLFLMPLRFSFIALAGVAFAFLVSDQGYDIVAHLGEDDPTGTYDPQTWQRVGFVVTVILFALQLWYWSRQLLHMKVPDDRPQTSDFPRLTQWLPRILGVLAFIVAIGALWRVWPNYDVPQPQRQLQILAVILGIALALFVGFVVLRRKVLAHRTTDQYSMAGLPRVTKVVLAVTFALSVAFFVWATVAVQSTVGFGSAAIVILVCGLAIPFGSAIVYAGMRGGVPVLTFLLLWAVVISPLADNHVVKTFPATAQAVAARPTVAQAFDRWFTRLERDYPGRQTYPVFLVATEGGGIRAAYWTATVLTSLSDSVPAFTDHLFAISGVSGGSLGATVYDALLVKRQEAGYVIREEEIDADIPDDEMHLLRTAARHVLAQDSLTPTLAAMLQPDLAQRFVPAPVLPDRARALEGGWERAWSETIGIDGQGDRLFSNGFLAMMTGREDRLPSLFLNGTLVESGQRIVASNLRIDGSEVPDAIDLFRAIGGDLRVSTAVANSTRFTYVSPAGTLVRGENDNGGSPVECSPGSSCEHVVDGGYFENSGAATASDILDVIRRHPRAHRIRPHVIFISFRMGNPAPLEPELVANEVMSPVRALLSTRGARGTQAVAELKQSVGGGNHTTFELVQTKTVFPLGWLLADRTRNLIDAQMGPHSGANGAKMRQIAALLRRPISADPVQQRAIAGEQQPKL